MTQPLQTGDASKILDCSPENVRALERKGELTSERTPSGRRIFDRGQVEALAERRRQAAEKVGEQ